MARYHRFADFNQWAGRRLARSGQSPNPREDAMINLSRRAMLAGAAATAFAPLATTSARAAVPASGAQAPVRQMHHHHAGGRSLRT
jgi:hypothetical protein